MFTQHDKNHFNFDMFKIFELDFVLIGEHVFRIKSCYHQRKAREFLKKWDFY